MNIKKVVIIGPAHPLRGGLASYNERLAQAFQADGSEVIIHTFSLQYPNFLFPGKTQYSSDAEPADLDISVEINSVNPLNWIKVGLKIKKQQPDLILCKFWLPFMGLCFGTILRIAKSNGHTKVASIIDNIIPHEKRIGDKMLSNYFVKSVDGFVAMSKSVLDDLNTFDSKKPKLYNPHPLFDNFGELLERKTALNNLGLDPEFRYILFFGFVRDYKGLDLLLEAFANEKFRGKKIKLIVAGEYYNNEQKYIDLIEKLNLKEHIVLKNEFIANEEVKDYFCAADIIAQPYKNATQSGVTQIGYHFEKPMLVTNVGGLGELIPHNKVGYVVEPNKDAISESLLSFYDENREAEMVENVKKEKEKFSWKKMIDTINELDKLIVK